MWLLKKKKSENLEKLINQAPKYDVNFDIGLTQQQVDQRIEDGLINKQRKTVTKSYFEIIVKNIFTVLNILLIVVASVMAAFGLYTRLFFVGILFLNIAISLFQDIKARTLVGRLSLLSSPRVEVIRDGIKKEVNFNELVLSDIIILKAGNTIPCDSIVLNGFGRVNESLLSGETDDIKKEVGDKLLAESIVTSGFIYARVIKIGNANYASKLQEKARAFTRPKSEILNSLTKIIRLISVMAIVIGIAEIITYSVKYVINPSAYPNGIPDIVDQAGSSIVGMIPIGMYLMTSITLTVGVIILARHRILVRELYSIEMLARVDTICLDKTGTLTDGSMKVQELVPLKTYQPEYLEKIISQLLFATRDDNLTARALKAKYPLIPIKEKFIPIPFSSDNKFSAVSFDKKTYVLGAFDFIKLVNKTIVSKAVSYYEKNGYRVLVIAESNQPIKNNKLPSELNAVGLIVLSETIKPDAKSNIDWFKKCDVGVRIVSGDSVLSLKNIAKQVGLDDHEKAISLEGLSDEDVRKAVHNNVIFGRVTPEQKKIIISELHNMDHTIAMVGDGVNDLLALKSADCSIAMASGSDAAKAVSHLVSLDSNFSALPKVVEEGRRVINNLQRVCSIFLVKTVFAVFMSILFLILSWAKVSTGYPFTTNHLMVWEVLTIGIAPFFVALEPNKERIKGGFIKNIINEAIPGAVIQIVISLAIIICSYVDVNAFPADGVIASVTILLSVMSFVILLHVCMPVNRYRLIILMGTFVAIGLFFSIDSLLFYTKGYDFLEINYNSITTPCMIATGIIFFIGIPLYFIVGYLFDRFIKKKEV